MITNIQRSFGGRLLTLIVAVAVFIGYSCDLAAAQQTQTDQAEFKARAEKIGIGNKVKLRLQGSSEEIKGTITRLDEDGLVLMEKKSGQEWSGRYTAMSSLKKDGPGIGTAIAVAGAIAGAVIFVGVYSSYCRNEGC